MPQINNFRCFSIRVGAKKGVGPAAWNSDGRLRWESGWGSEPGELSLKEGWGHAAGEETQRLFTTVYLSKG